MSDILTLSDPITVHDWRPSHPYEPREVIEARETADGLWKDYITLTDQIELRFDEDGFKAELEAAGQAAVDAQYKYSRLWEENNKPVAMGVEVLKPCVASSLAHTTSIHQES